MLIARATCDRYLPPLIVDLCCMVELVSLLKSSIRHSKAVTDLASRSTLKFGADHIKIRLLRPDDFEKQLDLVGLCPGLALLSWRCGRGRRGTIVWFGVFFGAGGGGGFGFRSARHIRVVNGLSLVWLKGGLATQDKTERRPATENPLPSRIYTHIPHGSFLKQIVHLETDMAQ
jgi:hypothetical protein